MIASDIFHKTTKGQSEVENKSDVLSLKERRVLILVNGENDSSNLQRMSLCDNIAEILNTLLQHGFIEPSATASEPAAAAASAPAPAPTPAPAAETGAESEIGAREFMSNTLLTFANRVRVAGLLDQIQAAEDAEGLKEMVKPWYHALSETPGGMYQADDLRKDLLQMLESESASGMQ